MAESAASLRGRPVIVTGAGGWLGQAALNMAHKAGAQLYAFGASARPYKLHDGTSLLIRPLAALDDLALPGAFIFHMAFLTREHASTMPVADYITANRAISDHVARFIRRHGANGLFVPSSGAVYAPPPNPYGDCKREDETLFTQLGQQHAIPTVIMRVFNLAGPFINKLDSYALACIVADIVARRPITLRAAHPVWRGYAHVNDVLHLALGLLHQGISPPVFDSWGEPVELSTLARRAARLLGRPETEIIRPTWQNGTADHYLGDAIAYNAHMASLALEPASLERQILDTAAYLGKCFSI